MFCVPVCKVVQCPSASQSPLRSDSAAVHQNKHWSQAGWYYHILIPGWLASLYLQWNTTFDGRRLLTEDELWRKTTFNRRRPLTKDDLWRKMTPDGRRLLTQDDFWWKTTFDRVYCILPEKHVFDSSPWQPQHNWRQTGNPISCPNRK